MSSVTWKIPKNCTFLAGEDGTEFACHADTDRLHPLNHAGVLVMHAMAEGAETGEGVIQLVQPKEAKANGGDYSPPQVGDFGRAGLGNPARNEFASEPAGGACRDGSRPGARNAEPAKSTPAKQTVKQNDSLVRDGKCGDGNGPVNQTCEAGYTPTEGGQCSSGYTPTTGECESTGNQPGGSSKCDDGNGPVNQTCEDGNTPT